MNTWRARELREALQARVQEWLAAEGLEATIAVGRVNSRDASFTMRLVERDANGVAETQEQRDLRVIGARHGLFAGQLTRANYNRVRIVGWNREAPSYPVIVERISDGHRLRISVATARTHLRNADGTAVEPTASTPRPLVYRVPAGAPEDYEPSEG
jgi:hypothetical protein